MASGSLLSAPGLASLPPRFPPALSHSSYFPRGSSAPAGFGSVAPASLPPPPLPDLATSASAFSAPVLPPSSVVFPPPPHDSVSFLSLPGVAPPPDLPFHLSPSFSQPLPPSFPPFASDPPPSSLPSTPSAASLSFPQPPVFRSAPQAPEFPFDDDPHNRSFDSDSPCPPHSHLSDYRWMLDFLLSLFPQARGIDLPPRLSRSLFESIFPGVSGPVPPLPRLTVFDRVSTRGGQDSIILDSIDSNL